MPIRIRKELYGGKEKLGTNTIKILSFNVRAFNIYEWYSNPETSRSIKNLIQSEHPDIICLQEYYETPDEKYKPETFFRNTPYKYIHFLSGPISGYGIATFSKYPIIARGTISFRNTANETIFVDLKINGDTIRVYNNHLQSVRFHKKNYDFLDSLKLAYGEEDLREIKDISVKLKRAFVKRSRQVDSISSHIRKCPYPVLVCGDFNDTPVSYTYRKMKDGLKDAFVTAGEGIGSTYAGIFPSFRIDYILHSKEFDPLIFEKVEAELSDHYPIFCTLDYLKKPKPNN
jgi:endonuclease/exonuclease/phosphatase family metal-dependent hydrolase